MKVLIAGGTGFMGRHLIKSFLADSHSVILLTRNSKLGVDGARTILWDGSSTQDWGHIIEEVDVVINLSGLSLHNWPWTDNKKNRFHASRVKPGFALVSAIKNASHRPDVFLQISGINYYGLRGDLADEETPPGDDFLAQLTIAWEDATRAVEKIGVRHIVCRTSVVLAKDAILMWLMALPVRMYVGGRLGSGKQAMPWIHINDQVEAIRYLISSPGARGPYNLISPQGTSNEDFMRTMAKVMRRPYWFPVPDLLLRLVLGEMSLLVTEGRFSQPRRLLEQGYKFKFPTLELALQDILS